MRRKSAGNFRLADQLKVAQQAYLEDSAGNTQLNNESWVSNSQVAHGDVQPGVLPTPESILGL